MQFRGELVHGLMLVLKPASKFFSVHVDASDGLAILIHLQAVCDNSLATIWVGSNSGDAADLSTNAYIIRTSIPLMPRFGQRVLVVFVAMSPPAEYTR